MKKKRCFFWLGIAVALLFVSIGGNYFFNQPKDTAQGKVNNVKSNVHRSSSSSSERQESSKISNQKKEELYSKSRTAIQEKEANKSVVESTTQNEKHFLNNDLKTLNKKAMTERIYVKYPYGRNMNFERATSEKLEALENQYTLKGMTNLKDDYDGQIKSVFIFE